MDMKNSSIVSSSTSFFYERMRTLVRIVLHIHSEDFFLVFNLLPINNFINYTNQLLEN